MSKTQATVKTETFFHVRRWALVLMLGFLMTLQGTLVWRELPELKVDFENKEKVFTTGIRNPRFWSHGWH